MGLGEKLRGPEACGNQSLKGLDFQLRWGALSRVYSHIQLASKLSSGCDYALFKVSSALPAPLILTADFSLRLL